GEERLALNASYLSETGLEELQDSLNSACYAVNVPEEAALLVVAWLAQNGQFEEARTLIDEICDYFAELRFYPAPARHPVPITDRVRLRSVDAVVGELRSRRPNKRILAQKEAVEVWAPFYDRLVALFLEATGDRTDGSPSGWLQRAGALL